MAKLGIDFGSSYCTVAWINPNNEVKTVKFNGDGSVKVPTLIMATSDHLEFGFFAESILEEVSKMPYNTRIEAIANFVPNIKRRLSQDGIEILCNKEYSHLDLLKQFFSYLIDEAIKDCGNDYEIDSIYISHPVNWEHSKVELLCSALKGIGYSLVETCFEPVAAVKGYCLEHEIVSTDGVLVFDYGGGTTDVTLIKKVGDTLRVMLPPKGNSFCGGQDIDVLLYEQLRKELLHLKQYDISQNGIPDPILLKGCLRLKEMFAGNNDYYSTTLLLNINGKLDTYKFGLSRTNFNNIIIPKVTEAIDVAKQVINEAIAKHFTINKILMIGGSSNLTIVKEMLLQLLEDADIITSGEKDVSVALGNIAEFNVMTKDNEIPSYDRNNQKCKEPKVIVISPDKAKDVLMFNF